MTEKEYVIEMICSLPKYYLLARLKKNWPSPKIVRGFEEDVVREALQLYDCPKYKKMRKELNV